MAASSFVSVEVRKASDRFRTQADGIATAHSFSFGAHYDPGNVGFGRLVAHNDERLPVGTGYPDHPHRDVEIVTVVLSGALRHTSTVGSAVLGPGDVQRLAAGSGVVHSEVSDSPGEETRFLQAWLRADDGGPPSYHRARGAVPATAEALVPLAGGPDAPLPLGVDAELLLGAAPLSVTAPWAHLFVLEGRLLVDGVALGVDDAARVTGGAEVAAAEPGRMGRFLLWRG